MTASTPKKKAKKKTAKKKAAKKTEKKAKKKTAKKAKKKATKKATSKPQSPYKALPPIETAAQYENRLQEWPAYVPSFLPEDANLLALQSVEEEALRVARSLELPTNAGHEICGLILGTMSHTHRRYHNVYHVLSMFRAASAFPEIGALDTAQRLAILFHDVIHVAGYDVPALTSEWASGRLMQAIVNAWIATILDKRIKEAVSPVIEDARKIVTATGDFFAETSHPTRTEAVLDLDFINFGAPYDYFLDVADMLWLEVVEAAGNSYDHKTWCRRRIAFLERILARDKIFYLLDRSIEHRARENIEQEISLLKRLDS